LPITSWIPAERFAAPRGDDESGDSADEYEAEGVLGSAGGSSLVATWIAKGRRFSVARAKRARLSGER